MSRQMHPAAQREMKRIVRDVVELMDLLGMSQTELGIRVGWSPPMVTRFLKGKQNATLHSLAKIAEALDCKLVVTLQPGGMT